MFQDDFVLWLIETLKKKTDGMTETATSGIVRLYGRDPFLILVSCVLSLRTKDTVTLPASKRLFEYAKTPQELLQLSTQHIQELIFPVGFYRQKAVQLQKISMQLLEQFEGEVPSTKKELLSLPGVGIKTTNLVLAEGFGIPALCVDTHVHRISNRLGLVATRTPEETERALQKIIPKKYWIAFNGLLVMWGQNQCVPISPFCSTCPLQKRCPKIGVKKQR